MLRYMRPLPRHESRAAVLAVHGQLRSAPGWQGQATAQASRILRRLCRDVFLAVILAQADDKVRQISGRIAANFLMRLCGLAWGARSWMYKTAVLRQPITLEGRPRPGALARRSPEIGSQGYLSSRNFLSHQIRGLMAFKSGLVWIV